jgi:hypothetical protein
VKIIILTHFWASQSFFHSFFPLLGMKMGIMLDKKEHIDKFRIKSCLKIQEIQARKEIKSISLNKKTLKCFQVSLTMISN